MDRVAGLVVASALSALCIVLADRVLRPDWDFSWWDHWLGAPVLYLAPAALVGLVWTNVHFVQEGISQRFRNQPRRRDWVRAAVVGLIAAALVAPIAEASFSGASVSETWLGAFGPWLFESVVFLGCMAGSLFVWRAQRRVARGRSVGAVLLGTFALALGAAALFVDMNYYVGLYTELHTFLEASAFGLFLVCFQLLGFVFIRRRPQLLVWSRALAGGLLFLGLSFVALQPFRTWTDAHLAHAWVDEFYVGRALRRASEIELALGDGGSLNMARMQHLARHNEIENEELADEWLEASPLQQRYPGVKNIVFFYVDTLRADTAADPELMPHFAKFQKESLSATRAYATGSDTLRSLPTITSGNYFIDRTHPGDLLKLAEEKGVQTTLIAAKSANVFLKKLLPVFSFEETIEVADYEEGEKVWGYGAHRPTAKGVTDEALTFLRSKTAKSPFLLWLFHFDAHAWREVDDDYISAKRKEFGIPRRGHLNIRYRVIARALDEQFGRLLAALDETGRRQDTAVVFLSDHGEGMGQGGFWVHSIFLWESLVRVPLAIRIPGVLPRVLSQPVSLVDVAPSLAPILGGKGGVYHGEELPRSDLGERRFPLLLRAGRFERLDRVGVVDPGSGRKLVVRLEAAFTELYAYERDRLDRRNLARREPETVRRLLRALATTPVYPRGDEDFELHRHPDVWRPSPKP